MSSSAPRSTQEVPSATAGPGGRTGRGLPQRGLLFAESATPIAATRRFPGTHPARRPRSTSALMIVGLDDHLIPTDLALTAHERALEPERLTCIGGGRFAPCSTQSPIAAQSALDWSGKHLT
ncbi:hypothetical protein ABZ379_41920 [Streptomyces canus]|uniref:hypothetical protein n=2 Tax=Streptomyces TaxID=1883 RepID=UPI003404A9A0